MASRKRKQIVIAGLCAVVATTVFLTANGAGASSAGDTSALAYPRNQTLITSGNQWGNIAGTNPYVGNFPTGMVGLVNETLVRYDPIKDKYINWLASSAKWTGAKQYTIVARSGVKWADGKSFTAADIAFNLNLLRYNTSPWNNLYLNLKTPIKAAGNRIVLNFKATPNYAQWQNAIYNIPMVSPTQVKPLVENAADLTTFSPANPVGTGPYTIDSLDQTTRVVYAKKAHWWAADQGISPSPAPKYIIDLVNTSNTNSLSAVLAGVEDLNNNYLPGTSQLVDQGKVQTYYKSAPYNLSANTAWLEPNTSVKPLNDPVFRRALAESINIGQIVKEDYGNLVLPASPAALLPTQAKYIDKAAVAKDGFKYDPADAQSLLTKAGYKKGSDGYFDNKDGSAINLEISVPQGWSDWETARDMVVASAKSVGIKLTAKVKDFNTWQTDRNTGKFDLVIDNPSALADSSYRQWNIIFHLPIITTGTGQTNYNYERYSNDQAWALTQKLDKTQPSNTAAIKQINSQLQTILLQDLPVIPLWYNGYWAQFTSKYWTNWPAAGTSRQFIPVTWRAEFGPMTGLDVITHLKRAK